MLNGIKTIASFAYTIEWDSMRTRTIVSFHCYLLATKIKKQQQQNYSGIQLTSPQYNCFLYLLMFLLIQNVSPPRLLLVNRLVELS